ncbi:hypothetical protein VTK73DRAFT_8075 [Phialemonium thermophilum]|uniref:Alpha/beta hydrolase fold-3 domain-containing protein n=1 Tax=Phialemonium thermophilum TaxID=223376 RepID=A0ABR3XQV9_9PEZI
MAQTSAERDARFKALVDILLSIPASIFEPFEIHRTHYQSSSNVIEADLLIPKKGPGPQISRPIIVRIHGGFLFTGSSLFPAWFSKWILDFAELHGAVIISPNYRLLPEVRGKQLIDDMEAFWTWFNRGGPQQHLESVGRSDVFLDMSRILLIGESAGGYLAIQSVLSRFARPQAMVMLYPMLDMQSEYYNKPYEKPICGVPNFPNEIIDRFVVSRLGQASITEADPPHRLDVALAVVQNGRLVEFLGDEPDLFVFERLRTNNIPSPETDYDAILPPLFIFHGENDSAVPVSSTLKFVRLLQGRDVRAQVRMTIRPGDHGFDAYSTVDEVWLREGLNFVTGPWLGSTPSPNFPCYAMDFTQR